MAISIKEYKQIIWMMLAAFGLYFCTYAIRKPFLSGTYDGLSCFGFTYKSILILVQVLGYMISKVIGIRLISEINYSKRIFFICLFLGIAQVSLFFFAIIKPPYNIVFIFFNGLPLGMIYGLIFSFLEGRKVTELLGISLSINLVMTSGILKSIYLYVQHTFQVSEMWIPFFIAIASIPFLILFIWMLQKIPPPSKADITARQKRLPMTQKDRLNIIRTYGLGLFCMVFVYTFFTTIRDFRDNFSIEIWKEVFPSSSNYSIFAQYESTIAVIVMAIIGLLITIKSNQKAFRINSLLIFSSMFVLLAVSLQFKSNLLSYQTWYLISGVALFLPYLLIQVAFFERLLAILKIKANVGFLIYICDSVGYLGSVSIMFVRESSVSSNLNSYATTLIDSCIIFSALGLILVFLQYIFFEQKLKKQALDINLRPV